MRLVAGQGGIRRLEFAKVNHAEAPDEIWHRIPRDGGRTIVEQAPEAKAAGNRDKVLDWVSQQAIAVSTDEVAQAVSMSERTAFRHLETLAEDGTVRRLPGRGRVWCATGPARNGAGPAHALSGWAPL